MRAAWYERQGPADEVLLVGDLPDPEPGPGEVRVRVRYSGVNPGDTKKRRGWLGSSMPYRRVIPHSNAAGVADRVGDGVSIARVGQRVWMHGAQSYRPFGTAAEFIVVPSDLAVDLPPEVTDEVGASPGITAHCAVFGDGAVTDTTVLCTAYSAASETLQRNSLDRAAPRSSAQCDTTQTWTTYLLRCSMPSHSMTRTRPPRSAEPPRTVSIASSKSRSRTTPTWTQRS